MYGGGGNTAQMEPPTLPPEPWFVDPIERLKGAMKQDMYTSLKELK